MAPADDLVTASCDRSHFAVFQSERISGVSAVVAGQELGELKMPKGFRSTSGTYRRIGGAIAFAILLCVSLYTFSTKAEPNGNSLLGQQTSAQEKAARTLDPQVDAVVNKMKAAGVLHPRTVEQVRKAYLFYPTLSGKPETVFRVTNRSIPGPAGNIPIRVYVPSEEKNLPVFVFFHGGAFVAGSLDSHDTPLRAVANRCGCIVVSVAYRLAPENPYPAAPNDAYAATQWVANHAAELGGDPKRIAVGGDGDGGNLAAVTSLMARDRGGPHLVYQVLIYPSLDALMLGSRYESKDPTLDPEARAAVLGAYLPLTTNLEDPYVSPVLAKNLRDLPATLVVTDEDDPARDEGQAYAKDLAMADVDVRVSSYPNLIHGFFLMAGELDAAKKSIEEISAALRTAFAPAAHSAGLQGESQ